MSVLIDVADATKNQLNAATTLGITLHAERVAGKRNKTIEELKSLVTEVVPRMIEFPLEDRSGPSKKVTVDIFLRRKMGLPDQEISTGEIDDAETDPLQTLAEAIVTLFIPAQPTNDGRLDGYEDAAYESARIMSGPITDKFAQTRIWQSQIRLVFTI